MSEPINFQINEIRNSANDPDIDIIDITFKFPNTVKEQLGKAFFEDWFSDEIAAFRNDIDTKLRKSIRMKDVPSDRLG